MGIRVVLADDHKLMREGLCGLLEKQKDITVVGLADNGREAIQLVSKHSPDVVIMDISMPELNGIDATRQIVSEYPKVKVIILSMHLDQRLVGESLKAGAIGYVLKDSAFEDLVAAIKTAQYNHPYFSPQISGIVLDGFLSNISQTDNTSMFTQLSSREREVLQLIAEGKSTKEIAEILNISIKTVEKHRQRIMEKLNINNVAELTKYAVREGLVSLD
ncbi:MAG: response regulator [Armatimonadota bacterium]